MSSCERKEKQKFIYNQNQRAKKVAAKQGKLEVEHMHSLSKTILLSTGPDLHGLGSNKLILIANMNSTIKASTTAEKRAVIL
mmetsp:Transcript_18146/g.20622  ORF Transcript_18146/g.20622 Transcript_18146/m.20622 type:complete len:82 (+) Transcript_18146:322-567(+)